MKFKSLKKPGWIVTPAVSVTMAYGGVIACWFIFLACTLQHAPIFHVGPYRLIDNGVYFAFSGANLGLAAWLLLSISAARRTAHGTRRGQLTGIGAALVFLFAIQSGAQSLHTDLNVVDRTDPEQINRLIANKGSNGQKAVACLRETLQESYPGLREAASRDMLVYQHEGRITHSLRISDSQLRLVVYGSTSPLPTAGDAPWAFERPSRNSLAMLIPLPLEDSALPRLRHSAQGFPGPDGPLEH